MTEELEITLHDQITLKKKEAQHCIWNYILNSKPTFAFFRKKKNQKPTYIKNLVCIFLPCHLPTEGQEYQNLLFSPTDWDGLTSETGNHNISQTSIIILVNRSETSPVAQVHCFLSWHGQACAWSWSHGPCMADIDTWNEEQTITRRHD